MSTFPFVILKVLQPQTSKTTELQLESGNLGTPHQQQKQREKKGMVREQIPQHSGQNQEGVQSQLLKSPNPWMRQQW